MKRVLVVSPHFPPADAPDLHRVRVSLPHFAEHGWQPVVLAVKPECVEGPREPRFLEALPADVPVERVGAVPARWTRRIGVGALALRAYPHLLAAGSRLIRRHRPALVYFSTTCFPVMSLGPIWKALHGVPFVLDMQDPWVNDYREAESGSPERSGRPRSPKERLARALHRTLEPWTMKAADGLVAVSPGYIEELARRYPRLAGRPASTIPFGATEDDFAVARATATTPDGRPTSSGRPAGAWNGVYVGRGGDDMQPALRILFRALRQGLAERPDLFSRVRLHFHGTDYAANGRGRRSVEPVARALGVADRVTESPARVPYFDALRLLVDADFLVVPGSDDPRYTASKIYPYVLARRPMLAVFHERSGVVPFLERSRAGAVVPFPAGGDEAALADRCCRAWTRLLEDPGQLPSTDWSVVEPFMARAMTRRQCELFDVVAAR